MVANSLGKRLRPSLFVCLFSLFVTNYGNNLSSTETGHNGVEYSVDVPSTDTDQYCLSRGTFLKVKDFTMETCFWCYNYMPSSQFTKKWVPSRRIKYGLTNGTTEVYNIH